MTEKRRGCTSLSEPNGCGGVGRGKWGCTPNQDAGKENAASSEVRSVHGGREEGWGAREVVGERQRRRRAARGPRASGAPPIFIASCRLLEYVPNVSRDTACN